MSKFCSTISILKLYLEAKSKISHLIYMPPSMTGDTCIVSHQPSHSLVTQQWWPQHKSAASCWGLHLHCHHDQLQGRHLHGDPPPHGHHLRQEADQERDAGPGQECGADVWVGPQPGEKTAECVLLDINNKDSINLFIYYSFIPLTYNNNDNEQWISFCYMK